MGCCRRESANPSPQLVAHSPFPPPGRWPTAAAPFRRWSNIQSACCAAAGRPGRARNPHRRQCAATQVRRCAIANIRRRSTRLAGQAVALKARRPARGVTGLRNRGGGARFPRDGNARSRSGLFGKFLLCATSARNGRLSRIVFGGGCGRSELSARACARRRAPPVEEIRHELS